MNMQFKRLWSGIILPPRGLGEQYSTSPEFKIAGPADGLQLLLILQPHQCCCDWNQILLSVLRELSNMSFSPRWQVWYSELVIRPTITEALCSHGNVGLRLRLSTGAQTILWRNVKFHTDQGRMTLENGKCNFQMSFIKVHYEIMK